LELEAKNKNEVEGNDKMLHPFFLCCNNVNTLKFSSHLKFTVVITVATNKAF